MVRLQKALGGSLIPLDLGSAQTARHPVDFWLANHPLVALALLLNGPGRFSFDAAMGPELISGIGASNPSPESGVATSGALIPAAIPVEAFNGSPRWAELSC